ncbi:MAG: hypothetical protein JZD41_04535 [Thermoproteus sp.]|nr:hypothetical protein [Thermoproteus sp.]
MRHTAEIIKLHLAFVHNLIREKAFYIGLTTAFAAYIARAFAGGMFVPYALKDVSNGLYSAQLS